MSKRYAIFLSSSLLHLLAVFLVAGADQDFSPLQGPSAAPHPHMKSIALRLQLQDLHRPGCLG